MSIDVVNSIFANKIDAHISRLQTNVVDNYLAIEAKKGIYLFLEILWRKYSAVMLLFFHQSHKMQNPPS